MELEESVIILCEKIEGKAHFYKHFVLDDDVHLSDVEI